MIRSVCWRLGGSAVAAARCAAPTSSGTQELLPVPLRRCSGAAGAAGAAEAGDGGAKQRRRLWRWGGTSGLGPRKEAAPEASKEPALLEDVHSVEVAACGSSHSAFVAEGQLYTYGSNKYKQLGHPPREGAEAAASASEPGAVALGEADSAVVQVSLGAYHSAAVTADGHLWTWGWGGSFWYGAGALGHGSREAAPVPKRVEKFVELGEQVRQVACGAQHALVLTAEGRLYSTGKGDFGRLGRGDTRDQLEFEEIDYFLQAKDSILAPDTPTTIVKVGAGNNFSAAMSSSGELWVWGRNDHGQLGLGEEAMGDMYSAERYPRLVRGLPSEGLRILDFACGEFHLVVVTDTGALYEWGGRAWLEPHEISLPSAYRDSLKSVTKLAAGEKYSFALSTDGTLYSWGSKASGCLAQGPDCPKTLVEPTPVAAAAFRHQKVVDIAASKNRCLAITLEDEYAA